MNNTSELIYSSPTEAALPDEHVVGSVEKDTQSRAPARVGETENVDPELLWLRVSENFCLKQAKGWKTSNITFATFDQGLLKHRELQKKHDAEAFVPGTIEGDQRKSTAISELCAFVFDLDKGEDLDAVRHTLQSKGLLAFIYSTHSHLSTETEVKIDDYRKFTGDREITSNGLRSYLAEKKRFLPWLLEDIQIAQPYRDTADGAVCVAKHAPVPKYRIVIPFEKPFTRRECFAKGMSQAEFEEEWKAKYAAFATSLSINWDQSCSDLSRAFYYPSCKPGAPHFAEKIAGRLLNFDEIEGDGSFGVTSGFGTAGRRKTKHAAHDQGFICRGFDLKAWIAQYGATFEIETALRSCAPSIIRSRRSEKSGFHITCPFEETHSEAGGDGTFVVNASENEGRGFGIHCCHDHCLTERGDGKK